MKNQSLSYWLNRSHLILILFTLMGCATVPLTGRRQLSLVPESEVISLSLTEYDKFIKSNKLSTDKNKMALVKRVGERISKAVEAYMTNAGLSQNLDGYKWEFNLVEDQTVNAWCMSGGKVVVYTGLLPLTLTESGLATVLGHEISHAVARHGSERMSNQMLLQMGSTALSTAMASKPAETRNIVMTAFGIGSQVGVVLPFSRDNEYEADYMGLIFMAMAGYDPNESIPFWERMSKQGGQKPPQFLSTHPVDANRIARLKEKMPDALTYYKKNK
ncbi:MAG: M48 family metallopeptidase [Mariniphaga sp.]